MKKRKKNHAERARQKQQRRKEARKRKGKGTTAMTQDSNAARIRGYMEKKAYADAVNAFADMAGAGTAPEECFGDIARAYFETGDTARAADWVTTTLTRDPANMDVRILLGRICLKEKRTQDAFKIYENLLASHGNALSDAQRAEIDRYAGLEARLSPAEVRENYPHLAAFFGLVSAPVGVPAPSAVKKPAVPAPKGVAVPPTKDVAVPASKSVAVPSEKALAGSAAQTAAKILGENIRPRDKVCTLNAFAGAAYVEGDYESARILLTESLRLDPGCDETIKNMAVLLHDMGDNDRAIRMASEMKHTDFLLLRLLKA